MSQHSMFSSAVRSFLVSLFGVVGIAVGIIVIAFIVGGLFGRKDSFIGDYDYMQLPDDQGQRQPVTDTLPVILWVNIDGTIGTDDLSAGDIATQFLESREGMLGPDRVKAVFLHIDTPGGSVIDADNMYMAIQEYKKRYKVPVYAFVDGLCASGGMYVACSADKIYASEVSIIGSVGVISWHFNVSQLLEKVGVQALTLKQGMGKDELDPFQPWKPGAQENEELLIKYYYQRFVDLVVAARPKLTKQILVEQLGAHIFAAPTAQELGYIDEVVPTYNSAMKDLVKTAGLEGADYAVFTIKSNKWFGALFKSQSSALSGKMEHRIEGMPHFKDGARYLYYYNP